MAQVILGKMYFDKANHVTGIAMSRSDFLTGPSHVCLVVTERDGVENVSVLEAGLEEVALASRDDLPT